MITLSTKKRDESRTLEVHTNISEMEAQLSNWKTLCKGYRLEYEKSSDTIERIISWLPCIKRIHVGCESVLDFTEITFFGHNQHPWGASPEGQTIKFYEVGIERFIADIVMGKRAINDGLDMEEAGINVPEEQNNDESQKYFVITGESGELVVLETSDDYFEGYVLPPEKSKYEQVFRTKSAGLFYEMKRWMDNGYRTVTLLDMSYEQKFISCVNVVSWPKPESKKPESAESESAEQNTSQNDKGTTSVKNWTWTPEEEGHHPLFGGIAEHKRRHP